MNYLQIAPRRPINPRLEHDRSYKRWAYAIAFAQDNDLDAWSRALWRNNPTDIDTYPRRYPPVWLLDPALSSESSWIEQIHANNPCAELLSEF